MNGKSHLAQWAVLIGGCLGILIVSLVAAGQFNLADVLIGKMPLRLAIALSSNALPFLAWILLICLIVVLTAIRRKMSPRWAGLTWLGAAGILAYSVYYSRFSIGPLLIPTTVLIAIAGLTSLSQMRR